MELGDSTKMLRISMKESLEKSGVIQSIKAQMRREFISNISNFKDSTKLYSREYSLGLMARIMNSIVFHYLKSYDLEHTLSVYMAETDLNDKMILSEREAIDALHIGSKTKIYTEFYMEPLDSSQKSQKRSLLDSLIREFAAKTLGSVHDCSTQTEAFGPSAREVLDNSMKNLYTSYRTKIELELLSPARSVEERILAYQRECEERFRRDYASQLEYMRGTEIAKMRLEEGRNNRLALESQKKDLAEEYERKLAELSQRESNQMETLLERERKVHQQEYELRQRLQMDLDDLRSRESAHARKLELEAQGMKLLENRLREMQSVLESREKELTRKEKQAEDVVQIRAEKARGDLCIQLESELETLVRERMAIKDERDRMAQERINFKNQIDMLTEQVQRQADQQQFLRTHGAVISRYDLILPHPLSPSLPLSLSYHLGCHRRLGRTIDGLGPLCRRVHRCRLFDPAQCRAGGASVRPIRALRGEQEFFEERTQQTGRARGRAAQDPKRASSAHPCTRLDKH